MEQLGPVFTTENECQDCYKCVRHCHCKAIRIVEGKASVIPEACVACGECVKVCPAHAKKIRSDMSRLRILLASGKRIFASIAPSFVGYFPHTTIQQIAVALKKAGFEGVGETAIGAEALSAETCEYLRTTDRSLVISSACPSVVDYIRKYYPQYTSSLVPFASPIVSHCRIMRKRYGSDIKVVFFGPCAAKKNESDRNRGILDLALTFTDLETLLAELNIELRSESETGDVVVDRGAEGRFYSIEGGMNDTLRDGNSRVRYLAVSGLDNLSRLLNCRPGVKDGRVIYLEALACHGGCVNGPVMPANSSSLDVLFRTDENSDLVSSHGKTPDVSIASEYREDSLPDWDPPEEEIQKALARVGKYGKSDELNCGACGYNTCRDFARALLRDKAEEAMCHNYLRRNYQRTSNALIKYIPAAVVIVDDKLCVTECNRNFAELTGDTEIYDSLGGLDSLSIQICFSEYADLFSSVLENGGEIEKYNQKFKDRIINISVFTVAKGKYAGAVVSDVTRKEFHREQIAAKAREVIQKNVLTVQQVARLFGEHIAETEIMLNEIAGSYESENEASHE